jgi:hypothetical protein
MNVIAHIRSWFQPKVEGPPSAGPDLSFRCGTPTIWEAERRARSQPFRTVTAGELMQATFSTLIHGDGLDGGSFDYEQCDEFPRLMRTVRTGPLGAPPVVTMCVDEHGFGPDDWEGIAEVLNDDGSRRTLAQLNAFLHRSTIRPVHRNPR